MAGCVFVSARAARVEVYPQSFDSGGWVLDAQFMDVMGSPYLLAHGLGVRVTDAKARVVFPTEGEYRVWVRTRNWADGAPGRFRVLVDGKPLEKEFGAGSREWAWEDGGMVAVAKGEATVALGDLTGFDGRCAGLVFMAGEDAHKRVPPLGPLKIEGSNIAETVTADFVVVGGGMPGTCAAVAAARRGLKVALVQDRPVLGGNASGEIRVYCAGEARYDLVKELRGYFMNRDANIALCDKRRLRIVEDEKNIDLHLLTRAFGVEKRADGAIAAVMALDLKGNRVIRFEAPLFCDATGDGWVGFWAGADWRMGREAKHEYGEDRAPDVSDADVLGASLMWTSAEANQAVPFSAPWAEPHAQGVSAVNGEWNWEYGIHQNMIEQGEEIRDRLLLAIYGAFSLAKKKAENANRVLSLCPWLLGKRESRRLMGDYVLSQKDVVDAVPFEDAVASGSWSIDLHYDDCKPGVDFLTTTKGTRLKRYWIPYRTIYSRNVGNLFMAGRCFSCTHVGLGSPRVISTLSQLGVAAGEAAAMCRERNLAPRDLRSLGLVRDLQNRLGGGFPGVPDKRTEGWAIVDDESEGVTFGKGWSKRTNMNGEQVGDYSHFPKTGAWKAVYPLPVEKAGRYTLMGRTPYAYSAKPGSQTAFEVSTDGRTESFVFDQAYGTGSWQKMGEFDLAPGATLSIIPAKSRGFIVADGFALVLAAPAQMRPVPRMALANRLANGPDVIAILHFGLNTYMDKEWGYGDEAPELFNPSAFDADQIVGAAKAGGIGGIVLVAKHHDGFCLWPTKTTDYNISKSPFRDGKGDYVKEMAEACRRAGLKFGVYVSPWDRNNADYVTEKYVRTYHEQLRELACGDYGDIFEFWFDGANGGGGWYGGAREKRTIGRDYYRFGELFRRVRELQPSCCIFAEDDDSDFRYPGNERGMLSADSRATVVACGGLENRKFLNPEYSRYKNAGKADGGFFRVCEADFPLRKGWFFHEKDKGTTKNSAYLAKIYCGTVGNGGTMNIGIAPRKDGTLDAEDVRALRGFKAMIDALFAKEIHDGESFNVLELSENLANGEQVDGWRVVVNGCEILSGTAIGARRIRLLDKPVEANDVKLEITKDGGSVLPVSMRRYFADPELVAAICSANADSGETDTAKWMEGKETER